MTRVRRLQRRPLALLSRGAMLASASILLLAVHLSAQTPAATSPDPASMCQAAEGSRTGLDQRDTAQLRAQIRIPIGSATLLAKTREAPLVWQPVERGSVPSVLLNSSQANRRFLICVAQRLVRVGTSRTLSVPFREIPLYRIDNDVYLVRWPEGSVAVRARFAGNAPSGTGMVSETTTELVGGFVPGDDMTRWFESLLDMDDQHVIRLEPGAHLE
jgi:hypothetical protein